MNLEQYLAVRGRRPKPTCAMCIHWKNEYVNGSWYKGACYALPEFKTREGTDPACIHWQNWKPAP